MCRWRDAVRKDTDPLELLLELRLLLRVLLLQVFRLATLDDQATLALLDELLRVVLVQLAHASAVQVSDETTQLHLRLLGS